MRRWTFQWALLGLCLVVGGMSGNGEVDTVSPTSRVVRVAFCADRGICEPTDGGSRIGVVPAWMRRIAAKRNWQVEWVDLPYAEALRQVESGKVDLMGGVWKPPLAGDRLLFSEYRMGIRRESLYVLSSSPFTDADFTRLRGCMVGVVAGNPRVPQLVSMLASLGAVDLRLREYDDAMRLERALFLGEVGAVMSDATYHLAEERELLTLDVFGTQFVTAKANEALMGEVDAAMREILEEEPELVRTLRKLYFPAEQEFELMLTPTERAWLAQRVRQGKAIAVEISPEDMPFKTYDYETGSCRGPIGETLDELEDIIGIRFEVLPPTTEESAAARFKLGQAEVWLPYCNGELPEAVRDCSPLMISLPEACCLRRYGSRDGSDPNSRISVWSGDHERLIAYAQHGIAPRLIVCDSREDCIRVVLDGRADVTYLPYGAARQMVKKLEMQDQMEIRVLNQRFYESRVPIYLSAKTSPVFASILAKALKRLTRDRIVDIIHRAEARENTEPRLTREQKVIWLGVPILAALLLLLVFSAFSRRRVAKALHRSRMALRVADDALKEMSKARERMREALDRSEFAARSKTNFLATMSHEIRTPLNAVIGFSEFLEEPGLPPEKVREYARGVSFSANSLLSLLNDILDISKFESGRTEGLDMHVGECDLVALFREMASVFHMKGAQKQLEVSFECAPKMPRLRLSEPRLRQILLNLVGNAVKFTEQGWVKVRGEYQDGVLRLQVRDSGIGISPRGLKMVFDPFSQDMESRSGKVYAGTGLGLSIVKRLVEASGGSVGVESELGKGTCFTVELRGGEALAEPVAAPMVVASAADFTGRFRRVLVVDDTKMNCQLLAAFCRKLGIAEVTSFSSAAETLAYFDHGGAADLVLSDLWMPGMNGSELARTLATRCPELPVVAVTADTDGGATFDMSVFRAVLSKPVTMAKLRELLHRLISRN